MAAVIAFHYKNAVEAIQVQNHRKKRSSNCFYSNFTKKQNSQGHFKYTKKHKIMFRNCCSVVITLCSPKFFLVILCPSSTVLRGIFIILNELSRVSNYPIDIKFHLQKSLESFHENLVNKICKELWMQLQENFESIMSERRKIK